MLATVVRVPAQVAQHDRRVHDIDADLDTFAADEHTRLVLETTQIRGTDAHAVAFDTLLAVNRALATYRDEERRSLREVRETYVPEGLAHTAWRFLRRRPVHELLAPEAATELVGRWPRMVPVIEGMTGPLKMLDPRARTIERVMAGLEPGDGASGDRWKEI
jgi:hypothetical protein